MLKHSKLRSTFPPLHPTPKSTSAAPAAESTRACKPGNTIQSCPSPPSELGHVSTNCETYSTNHSNPRSHSNPLGSCSSASPSLDYDWSTFEASPPIEAGSLSSSSFSEAEPSHTLGLPYCYNAQDSYGEPAPFNESGALHEHWPLPPANPFTDFDPANHSPIVFPRDSSEDYPYRSGLFGDSKHDAAGDMESYFEASSIHSGIINTLESDGANAAFQGIMSKSIDPRECIRLRYFSSLHSI